MAHVFHVLVTQRLFLLSIEKYLYISESGNNNKSQEEFRDCLMQWRVWSSWLLTVRVGGGRSSYVIRHSADDPTRHSQLFGVCSDICSTPPEQTQFLHLKSIYGGLGILEQPRRYFTASLEQLCELCSISLCFGNCRRLFISSWGSPSLLTWQEVIMTNGPDTSTWELIRKEHSVNPIGPMRHGY